MSNGNQGDAALAVGAQNAIRVIPDLELHDAASLRMEGYKPPLAVDHARYGSLTIVCAEPGMGKSHIATLLSRVASEQGCEVYRYAFDNADSAAISRRMVRRCSEVRAKCATPRERLMIIDGVTPGDEFETQREATAVERLVAEGAHVLLCIQPEAEQLAERLGNARRLGAEQLLFRPYDESLGDFAMTGGIPSLVAGRQLDLMREQSDEVVGPRYLMALEQLVAQSLRHGLMDEELRVRMAMLLLGEGTMEDVAMVSGRCDSEQFCLLSRDSPFFGIDVRESTFRCHGLHIDDVLEQCLGALQGVAASIPAVVVRACGALATQGRMRRAALVCRLCSSKRDFASVGTSWGVLFAAIGEAGLVREALKTAEDVGVSDGIRTQMGRAAVASVLGKTSEVDQAVRSLGTMKPASPAEQRLYHTMEQMLAMRELLRNPQKASRSLTVAPDDGMGVSFLNHQRVSRLMRAGRFSEAYSLISNEMTMRGASSLPEALVCGDLVFSLSLCGGKPDDKELGLLASSERIFARPGMRHMRTYHRAFMDAIPVLMGDATDTTGLEGAAAHAERRGDSFLHACFLAIIAVADVRTRALTRAHVRAERAEAIARALGEDYLAAASSFVNAVACELLGDAGALVAFCEHTSQPEGLLLVGRLLASVSDSVPAGLVSFDVPMGTPCPRDELWALNLLTDTGLALWHSVSAVLPPTWIEQMRVARIGQSAGEAEALLPERRTTLSLDVAPQEEHLGAGAQTQMGLSAQVATCVSVYVLGGFAVECDGVKVADSTFERRRARDLMMLLAVVPEHRMRRYQMIEVLYDEEDYDRGPRRLYEATGEARRCLKELCGGLNPLKVDRAQGSIGFDANVVCCDVDEFEHEARKTLVESGDDFLVLEHGRRMVRLYRSGPDERLMQMGELVKTRVQELQQLFVDASVAVGEAALRLGKAKLAIRYATDAHKLDELREDVVLLLVRSLKAAGRGFEVTELYREYSRRLVAERGVPPSLELRRAVELATNQSV